MRKSGKVVLLPMLLSGMLAAAAGAQATPPVSDCNVDENTTLSMTVFALLAAQQPGTAGPEARKQLQTAIGRMFPDSNPNAIARDNAKNPVGRAFVLGKIYMMFLSQEDQPVVTTRGALGFKSNKEGVADLSVGVDSAFRVVEEKAPPCAPLTGQWRQQAGWVRQVQRAMDFANSNKVDSADMVAQQALRISPTAPYSHLVLGNVAAQRSQNKQAIQHYKQALVESEKDTIFADVRRTILYTLGNFATDAGQIDTVKANKDMFLAEARAAFEALVKDPGKQYGNAARQGLTAVLRASGDTTAIHSACKDQLANPDAFDFLTLVQCGVTLAEIKEFGGATKLFESAVRQNPNHRDGLYNLALMQINSGDVLMHRAEANKDSAPALQAAAEKEYRAAIPTTDRLIALDPSNPDDIRLYVHAYNGIRKRQLALSKYYGDRANALTSTKAADRAKRLAYIDSAAKMDPLTRESLNKIVEWNTKADSMPVHVVFTEFTPGATKTTLSGTVRNRTTTEKSYTINVEFLDKDGKTVGTGKATVDKVRPSSEGRFTVTGTVPGIVAFRYAPIV